MKNKNVISWKEIVIGLLIITIIILIVGGIISYINYSGNNKKEDPEVIEKKYELLNIEDTVVQNLFSLTRSESNNLFANSEYENLYYNKDKVEIKKLDNNFKLLLAYSTLEESKLLNENGNTLIEERTLKEQYIKIFGDDNYTPQDIDYACPSLIEYNEKEKRYEYNDYCGGMRMSGYNHQLIEARKYEDKIEIYEKVVFYLINESKENVSYWKNSDYSGAIIELPMETDFDIENYLDNLNTYRYTFKLKDNNYYFEKVELVEK